MIELIVGFEINSGWIACWIVSSSSSSSIVSPGVFSWMGKGLVAKRLAN